MLCGIKGGSNSATVRVALVDLQAAQRSIGGYHTHGHGVSAGFIALGHNDGCGSATVNQSNGNRLCNTALAGSGGNGNALSAHGNSQFVLMQVGLKFFLKGAHRCGHTGQVRVVGSQCNQGCAVVTVVDGAVRSADGANQAVLGMLGSIIDFFQFYTFNGGSVGIDLNQGHTTGSAVIGCIAVQLAGFSQVSGRNQDRTLGIAQQGYFVQIFQSVCIDSKQVTGSCTGLHAAACTDVNLIAVHNRGCSCLRCNLVALQVRQSTGGCFDCCRSNVAVLGGEVHTAFFRTVSDGGALIAHAGQADIRNHFTGQAVQCVQVRVTGPTAGTVVATKDNCVANDHSTGPVVTAHGGLAPHQITGSSIDANVVGFFVFCVPVTGINVSIMIGYGRVVLATLFIGKYPDGVQSLGVKSFDLTARLRAEDEAIAIGRRDDGKSGATAHLVGRQHFASLQVGFGDGGLSHKDQGVIHDDHTAGGIGPAGALGNCPLFHRSYSRNGSLCVGDCHVVLAVTEVCPVSIDVVGVLPGYKHFCISGRRNTIAHGPYIPSAAGVGGKYSLTLCIGGQSLGISIKRSSAVEHLILCLGDVLHGQPLPVFPLLGSSYQVQSHGSVQLADVIKADFALCIHKVTETGIGIGVEVAAGVACNIQEVAILQDNAVCGGHNIHGTVCSGCLFVNGALAVVVIADIFRETEQAVGEVNATGRTADGNIVLPLDTVHQFVGIYQQMQCSDVFFAIAVSVIGISLQAVAGQFNLVSQDLQSNGQTHHSLTLIGAGTGGQVGAILADGNVYRSLLFGCERDCGQVTQQQTCSEQQADYFFRDSHVFHPFCSSLAFFSLGGFSPADSNARGQGPRYALIWAQVALSKSFFVGIRPSSSNF